MPDPPSFEYRLYERIEERNGRLILQVRHLYYTGRGDQEPYAEKDIRETFSHKKAKSLKNKNARLKYCYDQNKIMWHEANKLFNKYEAQYKIYPDDKTTQRLSEYSTTACIRIKKWFDQENIELPHERWKGSKTDFAYHILKTYKKHQHDYTSMLDATKKIFPQYTFNDPTWTWRQCYDLVRQNKKIPT